MAGAALSVAVGYRSCYHRNPLERLGVLRDQELSEVGMNKPVGRKLRCAIYTRKSFEEALEQEFNSLHAQG